MSGSYWWFPGYDAPDALFRGEPGWLSSQVAAAPRPAQPPRYFLAAGRFEDFYPWSLLAENRRLRDVLTARGYDVEFREFMGGHDPVSWRSAMVDGLVELTRDREE
jgi:enterochelin esterase-like enzyme